MQLFAAATANGHEQLRTVFRQHAATPVEDVSFADAVRAALRHAFAVRRTEAASQIGKPGVGALDFVVQKVVRVRQLVVEHHRRRDVDKLRAVVDPDVEERRRVLDRYESPFPWETDLAKLTDVFEAESDPFAEGLVHKLMAALGFGFTRGAQVF